MKITTSRSTNRPAPTDHQAFEVFVPGKRGSAGRCTSPAILQLYPKGARTARMVSVGACPLAGPERPARQAAASGAAVAGHNWSPFLGGAGGRGITAAIGAMGATAPAGSAVLLGGMTLGRIGGETAIGSLAADLLLVPVVS